MEDGVLFEYLGIYTCTAIWETNLVVCSKTALWSNIIITYIWFYVKNYIYVQNYILFMFQRYSFINLWLTEAVKNIAKNIALGDFSI